MSSGNQLTPAKLLQMVRSHENTDDVNIVSTELSPGTDTGENYCGDIISCKISALINGHTTRNYHWMVKLPAQQTERHLLLRDLRLEEKECKVYSDLLPKLNSFVESRGGEPLNFCPLVYSEFHEDPEKGSILALEHLGPRGYRDALNKKKGLDTNHVKLALAELARFHAATHVYFKSQPGAMADHAVLCRDYSTCEPEGMIAANTERRQVEQLEQALNLLERTQEPGQDFVGAYRRFAEKVNGVLRYKKELQMPDKDSFNVLCHGDTWFNNMLFSYNSDPANPAPEKVCLLDLALTYWSNPCSDLAYFIHLSTSGQLRRTHLEDWLEHYHNTLASCLHKLGQDPSVYPYRRFRRDYDAKLYVGLFSSFWLLPVVLARKEDAISKEDFFDEPDVGEDDDVKAERIRAKQKRVFDNQPEIKNRLAANFLELVDIGLIEL